MQLNSGSANLAVTEPFRTCFLWVQSMKFSRLLSLILVSFSGINLSGCTIPVLDEYSLNQNMKALLRSSNAEFKSLDCNYNPAQHDAPLYSGYCTFETTSEQIKKVANKFQLDHYFVNEPINENFYMGVITKGIKLETKGKALPKEEIARNSTLQWLSGTPCQKIFSSNDFSPVDVYASDIYSISKFRIETKYKLQEFKFSQFQLLYSKSSEKACVTLMKLSMSP